MKPIEERIKELNIYLTEKYGNRTIIPGFTICNKLGLLSPTCCMYDQELINNKLVRAECNPIGFIND